MTPRGIRNNNPGNIRKGSVNWRGLAPAKDQTDPAFWIFEAPVWGLRAIAVILQNYQRRDGLKTVRQMINRWAPPEENDTDAYVAKVASSVGEDPDAPVSIDAPGLLRGLVLAIVWHENGEQPYAPAVIDQALQMVGAR